MIFSWHWHGGKIKIDFCWNYHGAKVKFRQFFDSNFDSIGSKFKSQNYSTRPDSTVNDSVGSWLEQFLTRSTPRNFIASKKLEIKSRHLTWVGPKRKSMPWLWFKTRFAFVNKMLVAHNLFKFTCNTHFKRPKVWRFTISIPSIMVVMVSNP